MVVKDTEYTNRVPVQIGMLHINEALASVTREEYGKLSIAWSRANFPPKPISKSALSPEKEKLLFEKVDLLGAKEWSSEDQEKVKELFREYGQLFALDDLNLGHILIVKHKIELDDYKPFKDRY